MLFVSCMCCWLWLSRVQDAMLSFLICAVL